MQITQLPSIPEWWHVSVGIATLVAAGFSTYLGLVTRNLSLQAKLEQERIKTELQQHQALIKEDLTASAVRIKEELVASQGKVKEDLIKDQATLRSDLAVHIAQDDEKFLNVTRTLSRIDGNVERLGVSFAEFVKESRNGNGRH